MRKRARLAVWLGSLVLLCGAARFSAAAEAPAPMAVISFAGYEQLGKDLDVIGAMVGNPGLRNIADAYVKMATLGKGLSGLDEKRPWGVAVMPNTMQSYGFLPVSNAKELLETAAALTSSQLTEADGLFKINTSAQTVFAKQQGQWALIGAAAESFAGVAADPSVALATLPKQYTLAISLRLGRVPADVRDMYVNMALGMASSHPALANVPPKQLDDLRAAIADLDEIRIGLAIDATAKRLLLDVQVDAKAGTKLAAELAFADPTPHRFAPLAGPGSAIALAGASKVSPNQIEQILAAIGQGQKMAEAKVEEAGMPAATLKLTKEALGEFFDVLRATSKLGRNDSSLSFTFDEKAGPAILYGGLAADGAKLESAMRKAFKAASDMAPDAEAVAKHVKFDAETHQGYRFHKVSIPLDDVAGDPASRKVADLFGGTLQLVVAVSNDGVVAAVSKDSVATAKAAIDKSQQPSSDALPPSRVAIAVLPLLRLTAAVGDPAAQGIAKAILAALSGTPGQDQVTLTTDASDRGCRLRLVVDEGVVKAVAAGAAASQGGANPPAGGSF